MTTETIPATDLPAEAVNERVVIGNNSGDSIADSSAEKLQRFIERLERLDEEIRELNASKSDVYAQAKGSGYDVGVIRWAIKERRLDPEKRNERDDVRDLYARSLGMRV